MSKGFSIWNLSNLQGCLADRGIINYRNKYTLVTNPYSAYKMNLEISVTEYMEEKNKVEMNLQSKLVLVLASRSTRSVQSNRSVVYCTIQFAKLKDPAAGKEFIGEKLASFRTCKKCDDLFNKLFIIAT